MSTFLNAGKVSGRFAHTLLLALPLLLIGRALAADTAVATDLRAAVAQAQGLPRATMLPRCAFLPRPQAAEVSLSPDARTLAYVRDGAGGMDVWLLDLAQHRRSRVVSGLHQADIAWSGDSRRLWLADDKGLAVVDPTTLTARRIHAWKPQSPARLWALDARAPAYAVVHEKFMHAGALRHRYLRLDAQGATRTLLETDRPLSGIRLTAGGEIAYTAAFDGPQFDTVIRQYHGDVSRDLLRCHRFEECRLVGYSRTRHALWVLSQHDSDHLRLRRWRQDTGQWDSARHDASSEADADTVLWNSSSEDWLAIAHYGARRRWSGHDHATDAVLESLQHQLPETNLQLSCAAACRIWLVRAERGDRARSHYYLFDTRSHRLQALDLGDDDSDGTTPVGVSMHPISYRARDGMRLYGYVMLPSGIRADQAPLIAWLHGGPVQRVYDHYDSRLQLLVNRGYAVFIPNFRGSPGYGLRYLLAAHGDVGNGRVLDDIIDGLDAVLAQGIGDRKRQAVMGWSFGGYASLLAVSHYPGRFRFAVAGAPPIDYGWIKQWQAEHDSDALHAEGAPLSLQFPWLGFRYRDQAWRRKMTAESPLAQLPALRVPVYIWAGQRDQHVPIRSIVHYVGEARRLGKHIDLLLDPQAGHSPGDLLGADAALYLIERAANQQFGGGLTPAATALQEFLRENMRVRDASSAMPAYPRGRDTWLSHDSP